MPALWKVGALILLWLLSGYSSSLFAARSLLITANKSSLFGDEDLTISASASGFIDGEVIYIKGAFYQEGLATNNYFGYTKNNENLIKNGDTTTNQRSITIGQWDQNLSVKSDFSDGGYKGEGEYKFKVGFYYKTSGDKFSNVNWSSNSLTITLNEPDPTPTNSPSPTNAPTNTPTHTPTNTPTLKPTNTITPKPTEKGTVTPTQSTVEANKISERNNETEDVLGAKDEHAATSSITMERAGSQKVFIITFLFISIGCAVLSAAIALRKQFFSS